MNKIFQEYFLDDPVFRSVAILKSISKKNFKEIHFLSSEFINKILQKHLRRNLHVRKLFSIYEHNFWNAPVKEFFFSVYHTPGYICDCSWCTTLKVFDINFSTPPSRNSIFIHLVYNEEKIISSLYIFISFYIYVV